MCSNSIYYQCINWSPLLRASRKGKFPLTEGTQMAALLLKQSFHQWKNDRYLDTLDIFLHCFQWHLLIHVSLFRTGLNIFTGVHYCFSYYNHYQSSTFEESTWFFKKWNNKTPRRLLQFSCLRACFITTIENLFPFYKHQEGSTWDSLYQLTTN